jgi:hypothetical protein
MLQSGSKAVYHDMVFVRLCRVWQGYAWDLAFWVCCYPFFTACLMMVRIASVPSERVSAHIAFA